MSYCRFLEGDVYMFYNVNGTIECCACSLAPRVKSIFTTGTKDRGNTFKKLFGEIEPCKYCKGEGCDKCMLPGNLNFTTFEEAINHLKKHIEHGDRVPSRAFEALYEDLKKEKTPSKL